MSNDDDAEAGRRRIERLLKITRPLILEEIVEQVESPQAQVMADLRWLEANDRIRTMGTRPEQWTV